MSLPALISLVSFQLVHSLVDLFPCHFTETTSSVWQCPEEKGHRISRHSSSLGVSRLVVTSLDTSVANFSGSFGILPHSPGECSPVCSFRFITSLSGLWRACSTNSPFFQLDCISLCFLALSIFFFRIHAFFSNQINVYFQKVR